MTMAKTIRALSLMAMETLGGGYQTPLGTSWQF